MNERDLIEESKADMKTVKEHLRNSIGNMRKVAEINRKAGRNAASNVAMKFEGVLMQSLGAIIAGHADASDGLAENWPDYDDEITTRGGGR